MNLFVINRKIIQDTDKDYKYIGSYMTEYCGQDRSCGGSIEKLEFIENGVIFTFNSRGSEALEMKEIQTTYPNNFKGKTEI